MKKNDQKCFLWCHVRNVNPVKIHPERITREVEKRVNDRVECAAREKDFSRIEKKKNICINLFCHENKLTFPIYISDQKFENSMDLLLIMMTSHITCTSKILTNLCFTKQRIKTKNIFSRVVYSVLVVKMC